MNMITIPDNVSRYNDYLGFDRGLFKLPDNKAGRIYSARWSGMGDITAPGVLVYKVEVFSSIPTTVEELTLFSEGVSDIEYRTLTRNPCDNPIVIEGFAIRHYLSGGEMVEQTEIDNANTLATDAIVELSKGAITDLTLYMEFQATDTAPMSLTVVTIEYTGRIDLGNGQFQIVHDTLTPTPDKIRPLVLVMQDLRDKKAAL